MHERAPSAPDSSHRAEAGHGRRDGHRSVRAKEVPGTRRDYDECDNSRTQQHEY
jgi:hypothetical protein